MIDEILPYYDQELAFVKRLLREYTAEHRKIARRLRLTQDGSEDPHVSRLIEAFALLNARIRHKLDDEFPELTDALLSTLYPHYQAPIPSMAIARFEVASDLTTSYRLAPGTALETAPVDGEPCRFRTCYDTTLWPITLTAADYKPSTAGAPPTPTAVEAAGILRIGLAGMSDEAALDELGPEELTFYLNGDAPTVQAFYQALASDVVHVCVVSGPDDTQPVHLGAGSVEPAGFAPEEGLLPYPPQAFLGYRLLTEYFVFPAKFAFLRFKGLGEALRAKGATPTLCVYFSRRHSGFETGITEDTLVLGCTPIVNLFQRQADPIAIDETVSRYPVEPDPRRRRAVEVYSVDAVSASDANGTRLQFVPFYGATHWSTSQDTRAYWCASRRAGPEDNPGSEVDIAFVDLDFNPQAPPTNTAIVSLTCLNRDLPNRLPSGGGEPRLRLTSGSPAVGRIECLRPPTRTLRPPLRGAALWRLVSHLNLNHLSLGDGETGASALREILALYDFRDSPDTQAHIASIVGVNARPGTARLTFEEPRGSAQGPVRRSVIARGVDIELELDDQQLDGGGAFLLASVLERFMAHYCSLNAFTRVTARLSNREGTLAQWPARNGDRVLV